MPQPRVAALGGGHGLAASLAALKLVTDRVTAVVTVADDGGSSGRLRDEFSVLPPGDLRMALAALCDDTTWGHTWRDVLQHRFAGDGPLGGHAVGNLLIVSLWDLLGDTVDGLDLVGRLLNSRGRVLPMAAVPLEIEADVVDLDGSLEVVEGADPADAAGAAAPTVRTLRGQHRVATASGRVQELRLLPADAPCPPETLEAVRDADWVVLGPGSWFTSVIPHVLVPSLREALAATSARRLLNLNLELHTDETKGFRAVDHLASLARHAPGLRLDVVLADPSSLGATDDPEELRAAARALGAELVVSPVSSTSHPGQHDSLRLAAAYRDIIG